ncbi:MAG: hypothetical protein J0L84_06265 [Verrucomicrobia bacterium]|nr:hypothetical protein [Verrucomicrobiota bacterium]
MTILSNMVSSTWMSLEVDTTDVQAVRLRVARDYWRLFPAGDQDFVGRVFSEVVDCFQGRHPEFQAIDARYHDLEHTLQGTLCFSTLLRRRAEAGARPVLREETFQLGLLAILLHDTGYLKRREDLEGTGAKYTATHVNRSCDFAERFLAARGFTLRQIQAVQGMIRCTGLGVNIGALQFAGEEERIAGHALGTADLLGQMAAADYPEKLPILYLEFAESAAHNQGRGGSGGAAFASAEELIRKTPGFWRHYVLPKVEQDFGGLHRFLVDPATGRNQYLDLIEANLERLQRQLAAEAAA